MKVSRSETTYLCMNKNEDGDKVQMQDVELTKVIKFKYLGSSERSKKSMVEG